MPRLRSRGPNPTLADSEVVTLELVGEFWGLADDQALDRYFRRYHAAEFPALSRVHRPSFVRQAANLCGVKRRIQRRPAERLSRPEEPWLVDSLPLPVCRFARACTCRRFAGLAGWGYDPVAVKPFSGFRRHVRTSPDGVIQAHQLAAADAAETEVIWDVAPAPLGMGLGDRNDGGPARQAEFQAAGGRRLAPFKTARYDPDPRRSGPQDPPLDSADRRTGWPKSPRDRPANLNKMARHGVEGMGKDDGRGDGPGQSAGGLCRQGEEPSGAPRLAGPLSLTIRSIAK